MIVSSRGDWLIGGERARPVASLRSMTIEVVDYDDAWPRNAGEACAELRGSLPGLFTEIEHIGSTSVPGLIAKPIVDLMAAAEDLAQVAAPGRDAAASRLSASRHRDARPLVLPPR